MAQLSPMVSGPQEICKEARRMTILEELQHRRQKCVQELSEVDAAIEIFNKHPEVEQCLTQLARCGIYR
jgi:hypothetical protein